MHRSGTSLVMSWLERCGVQVSNGHLVPSSIGNKRGHFEDVDFVELHISAINQVFPQAKGWVITSKDQLSSICLDVVRQQKLIQTRNNAYSIWGWKDPRTVLFLEDWRQLIPDLKVLMIWRPCSIVVDSLMRRNHQRKEKVVWISFINAIKLWKLSNTLMLDYYIRYPQNSLLFSLDTVKTDDLTVFELINTSWETGLEYKPLSDVYERSMLQQKPKLFFSKLANLYPGIRRVTEKLEEKSINVAERSR
jgi:hypothetical protein